MLFSNFAKNLARKPRLALFLIVIFGIFLRLIFFSGMDSSDSLRYSKTAYFIGSGIENDGALTLSTRLGLVYPTALSYILFGINNFSSVLFVLLTSMGGIVLIFYFGRLLFNEKTGLMAAFLLSFFPLDVVYSTKLASDLPSAFFMAFGVYMFLYSEIKSKLKWLYYFISGIFIGIGYLIRESALLIALFFIVYILHKKTIKKGYFLVPLGFFLVFAVELLIFFALTGDPLFRIKASQQYLAEASMTHNYFGRLDFPAGLFHYPWLFLTSNLLIFFYFFVLFAVIYSVKHKKKETYTLLFWLVPLLLYISFGSSSLSQYIPFRAVDRYTFVISMPAVLLLSFFLSEKKWNVRWLPFFIVMFLLAASVTFVYLRYDGHQLDSLNLAYDYIKNFNKTIYADSRSIKALNYISDYKGTTDMREYDDKIGQVKDEYILINKAMIKGLKEADRTKEFPKEIDNPPANWIMTKQIGEGDGIIFIYYVG